MGHQKRSVLDREASGFSSGITQREALCGKETRFKNVTRVWKPKKVRCHLVIGMDVGLEETCKLSLCALVGRFAYKSKSSIHFPEWMKQT